MRAVFRVDSSISIGQGHFVRCLTLANELRRLGGEVSFITARSEGSISFLAERRGFRVCYLPGRDLEEDALQASEFLRQGAIDWLVVDHYGLDQAWEVAQRPFCRHLMVIDDLANRPHACDLLLDQNLVDEAAVRYDRWVPKDCLRLLGPPYALLRPEFRRERESLGQRTGRLRRVLIFYGGGDPSNETEKAIRAFSRLPDRELEAAVVVGAFHPKREALQRLCREDQRLRLHCQTSDMAGLMARADLSLGAGGSATWERCCLGLPALVSIVADNQAALTEAVAKQGAILNLGGCEALSSEEIERAISRLSPSDLAEMSARGMALVDGSGVERVVSAMASL
ncbi:MAG TPA: UDP-2,4-diacetamido-2,4,6-trideoxy-beta-L-altropyranose hydrolase [Chroococcales cyanobacterium]|jgi:UDP-2,4-diacetamido-2,4,6-trideoxy-beta-L-altropyranose hydrolase